jgi:anti-sigma regulatory factor (Ser/Thr protein kinase)
MDAAFRTWAMPAEAASVALARRRVTSLLREEGWGTRAVDDVTLMTSELVTNALEHARTPFTVTVDLTGDRVRVEIRDGETAQPVTALAPSATDIGGRGLLIVATLSDQWGVQPGLGGKSVWFERTPDRE